MGYNGVRARDWKKLMESSNNSEIKTELKKSTECISVSRGCTYHKWDGMFEIEGGDNSVAAYVKSFCCYFFAERRKMKVKKINLGTIQAHL